MNLPGGTVTFLFTDIEGSTRLWEEHPQAMRPALARHDALLRQSIEQYDGVVFKTIGDAFCAAFATAPDALAAALAAQLALHSEPWPEVLSIRVRMALHTGAAELRDNDYFGPPLNRVARLLSAGHGGQALVSAATQELVRDALPASCSLLSLGEHRLRDLGRPEMVFQLLHPSLTAEFPPIKSLDNPKLPNNLPQQLTSFIGREKDIAEVKALLGKTRLLTLTGSGGCGKTRLALQVAPEMLEDYPDGAWFVELASVSDPALVPQCVAQVLGVREEPGKPLVQILAEALKVKGLLLVLDNCEHLLAACAQLVNTLLRSCPGVRVLASSREGLGISGETVFRIPPLSLPDLKQTATPASLSTYEAVRLFVDRATATLPTFAVTDQSALALAQLCVQLDGIPLAIELAAARVRSLSVEDIKNRLDQRFRLLTGGSRTAQPRQQTLKALIDWSYDLLSEQEKIFLARLSVFAGGWTLAAAEKVCSGESIEDWEALDLLSSLVDKNLVLALEKDGSVRYRMLETVREYAAEKLLEAGQEQTLRIRHGDWFLELSEEAEPKLTGAEQGIWLNVLETEYSNLRAVLKWSMDTPQGSEVNLRLCGALWRFWWIRGYLTEGRDWSEASLALEYATGRTAARARVCYGVGVLATIQGNNGTARDYLEQSLEIRREIGDRQGIAASLNSLGNVARDQGDYAAARTYFEQSLEIRREIGDRHGVAISLHNLGSVTWKQGDYAAATACHEQ
ncbi:MAG: tetratricopeptide repeat protein, partial [Chthonomonadales bacterium]